MLFWPGGEARQGPPNARNSKALGRARTAGREEFTFALDRKS